MKRSCLLAGVLMFGALAACGGNQAPDPSNYAEAAEYAYGRAENAFDRRDYELARMLYVEVYQNYPYSQFAALSELRIADAYFSERSYARAIEAYRRFVRFHPTHAQVPEAEYGIALSFYEQMPGDWFAMPPSYERDLTSAESAYQALRLFLQTYGDTEFAPGAEEMLLEVTTRLASHELYVAEFYMSRDNALACARRCAYLLDRYPTTAEVPDALFLYARAMLELNDVAEASATLHRLATDHPDHELGTRAQRYIDQYGL